MKVKVDHWPLLWNTKLVSSWPLNLKVVFVRPDHELGSPSQGKLSVHVGRGCAPTAFATQRRGVCVPLQRNVYATIISAFVLTMTNPKENKEEFYNRLREP